MRKLLFRGFHPCEDGKTTILFKEKKAKGDWLYWNIWGILETPEGKFTEYKDCTRIGQVQYIIAVAQWVMMDKNHKNVFEGDRLKGYLYANKTVEGEVVYSQKDYRYFVSTNYSYEALDRADWELIGNKWEVKK